MQERLTEASLTRLLRDLHLLTWCQPDIGPEPGQVVIHTLDQVCFLSLQIRSVEPMVDKMLLRLIGIDKISEDLL